MILASVCMRGGSKGVPNKNTKILIDKPLMNYTFECIKQVPLIDDVAVSSDSESILRMSKEFGIENLYKRSKYLSSDNASKWDVFKDLVLRYEKDYDTKIKYLVDLDVTVPRRKALHVKQSIDMMLENSADVVITGYEPERNPYFNMMEVDEKTNQATIVKQMKNPIVCRQHAPKVYGLSPAVYVIRREALFSYGHWSEARCMISPIDREYGIDIDTQLDFDFVEFLIKKERRIA